MNVLSKIFSSGAVELVKGVGGVIDNLTTGKTVVLKESAVFYDENTGKSRLKKSYRDAN